MNEEQLNEFIEARLEQFFGKNVGSFKEKVNLLRSSEYERGSKTVISDIKIYDRSYVIDNRHLYIHDIRDENTKQLARYYALAIHMLEERNPSTHPLGWVHFSYTDTEFDQILPLAELYKLEGVANNLDQTLSSNRKQTECRQEVEKLKKEKFISFSLFNYSISLADVLKADVLKTDVTKVDLSKIGSDISEGLRKFPPIKIEIDSQEEINNPKSTTVRPVINKSTIVSAVNSDSLNRLDTEYRELEKIKTYLEKRDLQEEFPYYGNLLEIQFRQIVDNSFGSEKNLFRLALLEFYKGRFYVNEPHLLGMSQQFFKPAVISGTSTSKDKSFEVDDSVSREFGKLKL